MSGPQTREEDPGRAVPRPDPMNRFHGLRTAFEFDLRRLSRIAVTAIALMASTSSAFDLPFQEAIDFLRQKTATPTRSHRDVWDAAHSKAFMVAGANTKALVEDFQASIAKALEQGTTLDEFRKDFDAIVKTHGWSYNGDRGWRTRLIFETNLNTAYAAGRYAQMTRPETLEAFPYWQYHHSGAVHPRLQHKAWDGTVLRADDPFWKTAYPPNGYHCGCFVTPVSPSGLKRLGKLGPDTSPNLDQLGTDQPLGVDPSFAYNPGEAWLRQTAPGPKAVTATQANIAAFARSALNGKWPDGSWTPVAKAPEAIASVLEVPVGTEVRALAETIRAGLSKVSPDVLATVPRYILEHGKIRRLKSGGWIVEGKYQDGAVYRAKLQIGETADGKRHIHLIDLASHRSKPS